MHAPLRSRPLASEERNGSEPIRSQPIRTLARVGENQCEGGTNYRIVLEVDDWPEWGAGQFVMLSPGPETAAVHYDPLLPRPMAIFASSGTTGSQKVVVLYKVEGRGTQLLAAARVGEHVRMVGPLGRGFEIPEQGTHSILVGGGDRNRLSIWARERRSGCGARDCHLGSAPRRTPDGHKRF